MKRSLSMKWHGSAALVALALGTPAAAQVSRSVLPIPAAPFKGTITPDAKDATPDPLTPVRPPAGAPNVFVMMSDDVGFAMASAFGGPVPTPNFERIARQGQRYNRFHTTGICSPSRAALLTGRNHHNAATGVSYAATGYPGYRGRIPDETATIARTLTLNGYNTAMFGKHHNTLGSEAAANGPFDQWPTGLGFEYFHGYVGPETDQFRPNLVRGTNAVPNDHSMQLLEERLVDDAISWLHNQVAPATGKPFFIYFSPSSTHAPHQAPAPLIARFKGQFDAGWDRIRVETWRRQIAMGIVPRGTKLTERPDGIPAWDSLSEGQKRLAARSMEVAAAMLAYQDEQIGRILSEMERMGVMDNTLVALVLGDNGASADQGPEGAFNRSMRTNRIPESEAWRLAHIDDLGGPNSYSNYEAGWSWAMNAPLRWTKQYASMLGGIRNGMILSYPGHVAKPGSVCAQFGHLIDIVPTVLEAARIPAPDTVFGVPQKPMDGKSLLPSLASCEPAQPRTQYFEIGGKKGLWHNGWFASQDDGRKPWEWVLPAGTMQQTGWTLYNLDKDFSQSQDLSKAHPDKLQELIALWNREAERNQVYPVDHSFGAGRKVALPERKHRYDFWGKTVSIPTTTGPSFIGRPFTIDADLDLASDAASGVIMALGSRFAGWSLFLDNGKPTFVHALSLEPDRITRITAERALPAGTTSVTLDFSSEGLGKPAAVTIASGGQVLASGRIPATFMIAGGSGETLDAGRDTGVPVADYKVPGGTIEGDIRQVRLIFPK